MGTRFAVELHGRYDNDHVLTITPCINHGVIVDPRDVEPFYLAALDEDGPVPLLSNDHPVQALDDCRDRPDAAFGS